MIDAIVFIIVEAAKCKMSEQVSWRLVQQALLIIVLQDFLHHLSDMGIDESLQDDFSKVYSDIVDYSREMSFQLEHELPSFKSIDWRLDVQLGSRCLRGQCSPSLMMKVGVGSGKQMREHLLQAEISDVEKICNDLQAALQEAKSNHARKVTRLLK
eukprot:351105-Hanusia_phi.AAC.1